jgi:hypothetical protein
MEEKIITFDDIQKANETIITTDIKGKNYAEVNQRIKAFRMVYPTGCIRTEMKSNENGVCIFKAYVWNNDRLLGTGYAYEKENSTFINKTSYIENCETSAVGRALGMAGFGIDTSVASAEEVINAMNNQMPTEEDAKEYVFAFGKHKDKKLTDVIKNNPDYIEWLLSNSNDEALLKCIEILTGKKPLTEEEQNKVLDLMQELNALLEQTGTDREKFYGYYKVTSNNELSLEQLKDAVIKLKQKAGE